VGIDVFKIAFRFTFRPLKLTGFQSLFYFLLIISTLRINHSCVPNAETVWRRKKGCLEVRAIREIGAGEEVRICYLGKVRLSATSRQ